MSVLSIRHLIIRDSSGTPLVRSVSIDVGRAEILAVVGESGSGKTMLARSVLGLLPDGVERSEGDILLSGDALHTMNEEALRALRGNRVGLVLQEPLTSLNPAISIGDQLIEGLHWHCGTRTDEARDRAVEMLERVRIPNARALLRSYPHEFSGGMRQRIMLASTLLLRPELIIADEPTTALDTLAQREVLDLIVELGREFGCSVLLITHNLGLAARYADRIAVMREGELVEVGTAEDILRNPSAEYTRALVAAVPRRPVEERTVPVGRLIAVAKEVTVSFRERRRFGRGAVRNALDAVSIDIAEGEVVGVVGGSGSGKTTLGRVFAGLQGAARGSIIFDLPHRAQAGGAVQMVFQDPFTSLDPRLRVGTLIGETLAIRGVNQGVIGTRVAAMLESVGLGGMEMRFPHQLSGGQRQRIAIARALIGEPALVVVDEPTSALDMTVQAQVLDLFERLQREQGFGCLFITHDLGVIERIADRLIVMESGRIVEEGRAAEILNFPKNAYTRELIAASPHLDDRKKIQLLTT